MAAMTKSWQTVVVTSQPPNGAYEQRRVNSGQRRCTKQNRPVQHKASPTPGQLLSMWAKYHPAPIQTPLHRYGYYVCTCLHLMTDIMWPDSYLPFRKLLYFLLFVFLAVFASSILIL